MTRAFFFDHGVAAGVSRRASASKGATPCGSSGPIVKRIAPGGTGEVRVSSRATRSRLRRFAACAALARSRIVVFAMHAALVTAFGVAGPALAFLEKVLRR
jgi:hypothetical protein